MKIMISKFKIRITIDLRCWLKMPYRINTQINKHISDWTIYVNVCRSALSHKQYIHEKENWFCRYYISLLITFVDSDAPPRPPLPAEMVGGMGGKMSGSKMGHNDTTTDDESEEIFHKAPTPSQGPIMVRSVNLSIIYCLWCVSSSKIQCTFSNISCFANVDGRTWSSPRSKTMVIER